eukprot:COSAG01_NODE_279_length_19520_cov_41.772154_19_plen_1481_part_01
MSPPAGAIPWMGAAASRLRNSGVSLAVALAAVAAIVAWRSARRRSLRLLLLAPPSAGGRMGSVGGGGGDDPAAGVVEPLSGLGAGVLQVGGQREAALTPVSGVEGVVWAQQLCDKSQRVSALLKCLECAAHLLPGVPRQHRAALMAQVDGVQDILEAATAVPWLGAEWTTVQCEAVGESMTGVMSLEGIKEGAPQRDSTVLSAVESLLSALDSVLENFVDRAEVLLSALQGGGEVGASALAGVLEHGVAELEALCVSTPRRGRKLIDATSERAEEVLESMDGSGLISQLSACEESSLAVLCERLCAVEALCAAGEGMDASWAVACVEALLEELTKCGDPVMGATRMLGSSEAGQRMQGLNVLRALPRVVLEEAVEAEVAAAKTVCEMVSDGTAERCAPAWLAMFALCFRNGLEATECVMASDTVFAAIPEYVYALGAGEVNGLEGVLLMGATITVGPFLLGWETGSRCTGSARASMERGFNFCHKEWAVRGQTSHSGERTEQLLPWILEALASDDMAVASAVAYFVGGIFALHENTQSVDQYLCPEVLDALLALRRRIVGPPCHTTVEWWCARAGVRSYETTCLIGPILSIQNQSILLHSRGMDLPSAAATQWKEVIDETVHIVKMVKVAELSPRLRRGCLHAVPACALRTLANITSIPSQQKALMSPELVEVLLYVVEHNHVFAGFGTAVFAAKAAVNLVGRNEEGLTLTRQAVDQVLKHITSFFDPASRRSSYPVKRMVGDTRTLVHVIIPDTNKAFVIEHAGALDTLVLGLLLEKVNPRRDQEGAVELQEICALVLQNLALSPIGAGPMRAHSGVMQALRELASADSAAAKSEKARQSASGALFELEEEQRQAVLAAGLSSTVEHIMLSYNWDHQAVIKRVHASLVRRGYTTWIDVEKMQGSTVEAMADAVEGAAVMCYGISRAYKESANCRLEAQYAYQREKDMVPLMVEEGYRADGWLGMLLGTRLYYGFFCAVLSSEAAFEGKMEELCRELGERGQAGQPTGSSQYNRVLVDSKTLVNVLQHGGEESEAALAAMLEHGLEVLEALSVSTPRRGRRSVDAVCDRIEATLEGVGDLARQLAGGDEAMLGSLSEHLCSLDGLQVGEAGVECVATVAAALDELVQCADPVAGSIAALGSAESSVRKRGLGVLASLPRVVLEEVVEAEVAAAAAVCEMVVDRSERRSMSAWLAVFAVCFRNGAEVSASLFGSDKLAAASSELVSEISARGFANGVESVLLVSAANSVQWMACWELGSKCTGSSRATLAHQMGIMYSEGHSTVSHSMHSAERTRELLPFLLEATTNDDLVVASGVAVVAEFYFSTHSNEGCIEQLLSPKVLNAMLALRSRITVSSGQMTAEWWDARAEVRCLDTLCLSGPWGFFVYRAMELSNRPDNPAAALHWTEVVDEAVHIALMVRAADLSQRTRRACVHGVPAYALRILANISSIPSQQEALASSEAFVGALLYIAEHDCDFSTNRT